MTQNPANLVMVHSKACDNCRRLRVGCDRELPHCGRCRLSKNTCTYQHQLKREAKLRKPNQYESTLHTYRAFLPPPEEEQTSKPLVLKWVDFPNSENPEPPVEYNREQARSKPPPGRVRINKGAPKPCATKAIATKQRAMIKLVSYQASMRHSTSLQKMFFVLIGARFTKSIRAPLTHLSQGRNNNFFIRCLRGEKVGDKNLILVRLDERSKMTPELFALRNLAYQAHFRYENPLFMLFLGRRGFDCMFRSQLMRLAVFLSGLQYIPGVDKSLTLELITLTTEQLKYSCFHKKPCLDTIQSLLILYRAYIGYMLNPLVFTCLNLASVMAHSLGFHLTPPQIGPGDARSDLLFLERCLTYRLLFTLDSNSTYGLKSHPLISDETMYCKSLRLDFQSLLRKAFLEASAPNINLHFLREALLDNDTEVIGVISDYLSEDSILQRQLVEFRSNQPSPSALAEICVLEESFRRICVKHLSKIYAIMARNPPAAPNCDTLVQMASNYIALRLHTWMVVLHSLVTGLTECFHHPPLRPTSALKSALRVMDHYEAFGHHPYFLCGTAFIASALIHLKYLGRSPEATLALPMRVIARLRKFEQTWPLSTHIQAPILQQASSLGLSLD